MSIVEYIASAALGIGCVAVGLLYGARRVAQINEQLVQLAGEISAYDERMDGTEAVQWSDARPPDGEDYNELYALVKARLDRLGIYVRQ